MVVGMIGSPGTGVLRAEAISRAFSLQARHEACQRQQQVEQEGGETSKEQQEGDKEENEEEERRDGSRGRTGEWQWVVQQQIKGSLRDAPHKRGSALKGREEREEVMSGSADCLRGKRAGNRTGRWNDDG